MFNTGIFITIYSLLHSELSSKFKSYSSNMNIFNLTGIFITIYSLLHSVLSSKFNSCVKLPAPFWDSTLACNTHQYHPGPKYSSKLSSYSSFSSYSSSSYSAFSSCSFFSSFPYYLLSLISNTSESWCLLLPDKEKQANDQILIITQIQIQIQIWIWIGIRCLS